MMSMFKPIGSSVSKFLQHLPPRGMDQLEQYDQLEKTTKGEIHEAKEERAIIRYEGFTPKFARHAWEERMYDLNTRMMYVIVSKVMKDNTEMSSLLTAEKRKFEKAVENLEGEYQEQKAETEELQAKFTNLVTEHDNLNESYVDISSRYGTLVKKSMDQKKTISILMEEKEDYSEVEQKHQELKKKYNSQMNKTKILERKVETYERKLKAFKSLSIQPSTFEDFLEESMTTIVGLISTSQAAFWSEVHIYYEKLEKEFQIEINKARMIEMERYKKLAADQRKECVKQITEISNKRRDDAEAITKLREQIILLEEEVTKLNMETEEYKARMQVISKQTTNCTLELIVKRDEDERMQFQVDFYEALTKLSEEGFNKMETVKMSQKVKDIQSWFCKDRPEHIRQRFEALSTLIDSAQNTTNKSIPSATQEQESESEITLVQDDTYPQSETMGDDETILD